MRNSEKSICAKCQKIFEALENATRVTDAVIDLQSVLRKEPEAKNVFGRALSSFGKFGRSEVLKAAREIEELGRREDAWQLEGS